MRWVKNRWITLGASLLLGGSFLWSSYHKIADPPDFAKVVFNYKLLPAEYINLLAIYMPWLELFAGLAVFTGLGRRGGALSLGLLSLLFIGALSFNLYRGHPTICGCFNTYAQGLTLTTEDKFRLMKIDVLRDIGLFLLALQIFYASFARPEPESA
jgi:uncharacterized membrane protein YphA (DoxX/SURF4 family)